MKAKILSETELQRAFAVAESTEERVMVLLSHRAGLRALEIAAADWAMVTDASGTLGGAIDLPAIATKGKTGAGRIPMAADLRVELAKLHAARLWPRQGRLFARPGSTTITSNAVQKTLRRIYERAGLVGCSSHSGRRSFATRLLRDGVALPDLQKVLRHARPATTLTYTEASDEAAAAIARLGQGV